MSDYGDYSDYEFEGFYEDDLYVDDGYQVADDLAEHSVPSPPPFDGDDDYWYDWDRFDYGYDFEDGSCGYFDYPHKRRRQPEEIAKTGEKRKAGTNIKTSSKKRRMASGAAAVPEKSGTMSPTPTVLWRPQAVRRFDPRPKLLDLENQQPLNIFKNLDGRVKIKHFENTSTPPLPDADTQVENIAEETTVDDEEEWEDETDAPAIDQEALRAILQERLGGSGAQVKGFEQELLLQYAMRMLSGSENADEIAGELTASLLGGKPTDEDEASEAGSVLATEDDSAPPNGLSAWVTQQVQGSKQGDNSAAASVTPNRRATRGRGTTPDRRVTPDRTSKRKGKQLPPTPSSTETSKSSLARSASDVHQTVDLTTESNLTLTPPKQENQAVGREEGARTKSKPKPLPRASKRKAESDTTEEQDSHPDMPKLKKPRAPSYAAPTTSSMARTGPSASTRSAAKVKGRKG